MFKGKTSTLITLGTALLGALAGIGVAYAMQGIGST